MSKISHSAWQKYLTCPQMYKLHYENRLRPNTTSSALVFGTAIDAALNKLLESKDINLCIEEFRNNFKLENLDKVQWEYTDFDARLLDDSEITKHPPTNAWKTMRVKGRMLLEAYYEEIFPLIEEVEIIQKPLNDRPGVLDAIIKLRGYGRILIDHKTSARPYDIDSVKNDTQLALYAKDQGITKAGFIVLIKNIDTQTIRKCKTCSFDGSFVKHKTCPNIANGSRCHGEWEEAHNPKARLQIIVDDIPEINKQLVSDSISQVESAIQACIYPRNLKACGRIYGKPCPYINYCWKNDETGLEYKEPDIITKEKK